jgi:hypothetical protein
MDALARSCSHLCHHSSKQHRCTPKSVVFDTITARNIVYQAVLCFDADPDPSSTLGNNLLIFCVKKGSSKPFYAFIRFNGR